MSIVSLVTAALLGGCFGTSKTIGSEEEFIRTLKGTWFSDYIVLNGSFDIQVPTGASSSHKVTVYLHDTQVTKHSRDGQTVYSLSSSVRFFDDQGFLKGEDSSSYLSEIVLNENLDGLKSMTVHIDAGSGLHSGPVQISLVPGSGRRGKMTSPRDSFTLCNGMKVSSFTFGMSGDSVVLAEAYPVHGGGAVPEGTELVLNENVADTAPIVLNPMSDHVFGGRRYFDPVFDFIHCGANELTLRRATFIEKTSIGADVFPIGSIVTFNGGDLQSVACNGGRQFTFRGRDDVLEVYYRDGEARSTRISLASQD